MLPLGLLLSMALAATSFAVFLGKRFAIIPTIILVAMVFLLALNWMLFGFLKAHYFVLALSTLLTLLAILTSALLYGIRFPKA